MKYRLRPGQESFQVVDGPMAGRRYARGKLYGEVPPQEKHRFEEVRPPKPATKPAVKKDAANAPETGI